MTDQPAPEPAVTPDPQPATRPADALEAAEREALAEAVAEAKPSPAVEPKAAVAAAPKAAAVPEPKAEAVVEPKADAEPKAAAAVEPKAAAAVEPKGEAVVEPKAEAVVEPKAEVVVEPKGDAEPKAAVVEPEPKAEVEPEAEAVPEVAVEPEPVAAAVAVEPAAAQPAPASIPPVSAAPADAELVPLEALAPAIQQASTTRRAFLGFGLALAGGLAGAAVLAKFTPVFAEEASDATPIIPSYDPANRKWTYVVDTAACIGCGLCVVACKEENHVPEEAGFTRTWIERHTVTTDGTLHVDSPDAGINGFPYDSTAASAAGKTVDQAYFMPRLCMQCSNSPCTGVCPVSATYRTEDGVILVDARRCIGCGYCVVACPYGARYLVPAGDQAPNDTPGVADKCTWCYHRISRNQVPACVEVCPVGARKFGDATDPNSDIGRIAADPAARQFRPEYGTDPRVLYLGPVTKEA